MLYITHLDQLKNYIRFHAIVLITEKAIQFHYNCFSPQTFSNNMLMNYKISFTADYCCVSMESLWLDVIRDTCELSWSTAIEILEKDSVFSWSRFCTNCHLLSVK